MMNEFLEKFLTEHPMMGIEGNMPELGQMPGADMPEWVKEGPIYQIFVRNFSEEGTFATVKEKLAYLKDLGIKTIWLMPIHPISIKDRKGKIGSPYAIANYMEIDSSLGTKSDFKDLVEAVHKQDMRLIIDLVVNHTGNDHHWHSSHPEFYLYPGQSDKVRKVAEWSDITDLNYENTDLRNEIAAMIRYWVEEFNIDGYRCDVAGLVPLDFWEQVVENLRRIKKDIFMLAEWQSSRLHPKSFNAYYDWVLYYLLRDIRMGKRGAGDIRTWYALRKDLFPNQSIGMLFTENHDLPRTTAVFGKENFQPFTALCFLLSGLPLIYAGQENGALKLPSLFEKEPLDWKNSDEDIRAFYLEMTKLYHQYPLLRKGSVDFIESDNPSILIIKNHDPNKSLYAIFNFSEKKQAANCPEMQEMYGINILSGEVFDGAEISLDPWQVQILDLVEDGFLVI